MDKELVCTAALSHLRETFLVLPFRKSIIRSKMCVQTGCRARGRGFSPSTASCRGGRWGEERVWRHSSSLQGGKADTKNMSTVLEGWKSLRKGPNAVSPLQYMAKLPSVASILHPSQDGAAAGALKPPTAPLRHRKLSNRLTKGF